MRIQLLIQMRIAMRRWDINMEIIMFFVFLIMDISVVVVTAFVYRGKEKYSEGMILGVHIPQDQIDNQEVLYLVKRYKNLWGKNNLLNFIIGFGICFLALKEMELFIAVWLIWLCAYLILAGGIICILHRKLYDIKMKNNWIIKENTHMIQIDTSVESALKRIPISHWWSFAAILYTGLLMLHPGIREYFGTDWFQWIFPGTVILSAFLFWGIHKWMNNRRNRVYSEDTAVNIAINGMEKRNWSMIWVSFSYFNFAAWGFLSYRIIRNQWLYQADYIIYIIVLMCPVFVVIAVLVSIQRSRKKILLKDERSIAVDDDEYWKNGWYSNPNDTALLVRDRFCSANFSMNMARPAAKVFLSVTIFIVTACIIMLVYFSFIFSNASMVFTKEDNHIKVSSVFYNTEFDVENIQKVEILDKLPEDNYTKTNGADTDKYLIGHFNGRRTGKAMMYIYRGYAPVLAISLQDETVYINSKNEEDIRIWYAELKP